VGYPSLYQSSHKNYNAVLFATQNKSIICKTNDSSS